MNLDNLDDNVKQALSIVEGAWEQIFNALNLAHGLNWKEDENFKETAKRNAKALVLERCKGINSKERCMDLLGKSFPSEYKGMIVVGPVTVHSLCPHHFENVEYTVRIGYIPSDRCIGLSKVGRVIKLYGSQPILQETFTKNLADIFIDKIKPEGIGVWVEGRHNCMIARGLQEPGVSAITSEIRGSFLDNLAINAEFMRLCQQKKNY